MTIARAVLPAGRDNVRALFILTPASRLALVMYLPLSEPACDTMLIQSLQRPRPDTTVTG